MKATLLGSTGLIGQHLLNELIKDDEITSVTTILRRKVNFNDPKVKKMVIDFKDEKAFHNAIEPNSVIFCAIGTTNSKVKGNKDKYRAVDYDIPVNAAKFGLQNDCKTFVLVSSTGADRKSSNFYTRLKGEVEDKISSLGYDHLHIFRPSLLLGDRKEFRFGERLAQFLMTTFSFLLPARYKPIPAKYVARAMHLASKKEMNGSHLYHYKDILNLLNK